jgi:hypothetical protein
MSTIYGEGYVADMIAARAELEEMRQHGNTDDATEAAAHLERIRLGGPSMTIRYERGGRFWHMDCENHFGGVMQVERNDEARSLLTCLHCGQQGYYPVGGIGNMTVPRRVTQ